ncbi:MAG: response regulator [Syntrophomonadaceae bacterium]|nr:response regulator [Syntrophomonadaceae bacterium]
MLIAEDDMASRKFLYKFLSTYGECDVTVDGMEAIDAFLLAWEEDNPYDLICLDIMMPKLDGLRALKTIRDLELHREIVEARRAKIIMTTALNAQQTVLNSFEAGCEAYAAKPIDTEKLLEVIKKLGLLP